MGWYDCFDFALGEFTQPDTKATEIPARVEGWGQVRVLLLGRARGSALDGRGNPPALSAILKDSEYLERRPIGMAYEKARGYEIIFGRAGFKEIEVHRETRTFVSTDEEEWWRQMLHLGWDSLVEKIENAGTDQLQRVKGAIFEHLQRYKQADGIQFDKTVFFVRGVR